MTRPAAAVAASLADALASLAPTGVRCEVLPIDAVHRASLFADERAAMAAARPRRRDEFATGRAALRAALGRPVAVPVGDGGRPVLPPDVTGSIAHDDAVAVAVAGSSARWAALGVDLERAGPMPADEAALVRRTDEGDLDARMVFVLKEAAYKAWSALGGRLLDFTEMLVEVAGEGSFVATPIVSGAPNLRGRYGLVDERWLAVVAFTRRTGVGCFGAGLA